MIVLGVTGSIGMGKSTVCSQFAQLGAKICMADALVHELLSDGGAGVTAVGEAFPQAREGGGISREKLGKIVFSDPVALKKIEAVLHPLVVAAENRFIEESRAQGAALAALDIPLLFETNAENRFDYVVVVTAPAFVQRLRVMRRAGMTAEKFAAILARQMPDKEKRRRADFVIHTGLGKAYSFKQVKHIVAELGIIA